MAILSPITNLNAPVSCSHSPPDEVSRDVSSRVSLKCLQRFPGRLHHGCGDVFSSDRVLYKGIPERSNSAFSRVCCSDIEPQFRVDESASDFGCAGLRDSFISYSSPCNDNARKGRSIFSCNCTSHENQELVDKEDFVRDLDEPSGGVAIAVKILQFYKREISPILPGSCRFVPTCSEYGMEAFKKYGVVKGAVLTAWRVSRCNPLGGSGFDPPRWFDEPRPPSY